MMNANDYVDALMTVKEEWGNDFLMKACLAEKTTMTFDQYLNSCPACGGNWGGMLLGGLKSMWPELWEAIPQKMGNRAFITICSLLIILGVDTSEGRN